jgi:5-methylcytosine-specific restriction enzyme subunit McrC
VAKHLGTQLTHPLILNTQSRSQYLVRHREEDWFHLKPDLLVREGSRNLFVLDTKWKLIGSARSGRTEKYGLTYSDLYQLHAYGQTYMDGHGDVVLIYPKSDNFTQPLPAFHFPKARWAPTVGRAVLFELL